MDVSLVVKDVADHLADALAPAGAGAVGAGMIVELLDTASTYGSDDRELLAVLAELTRLGNLVSTALADVAQTVGRVGVPARKRVKSVADLLIGLGHVPAVAHRLARVGAAAASLPGLAAEARTGGVAVEHRDAVGKGMAFVGKRVVLDDQARAELARKLAVQAHPAAVAARARELAIELAPEPDGDPDADPDRVPVAEDADLNEMGMMTGDDGRTLVELDVDALTGEELAQALDPLCRPVSAPDGSPDPRSVGQRRADAFGQIIRTYLAGHHRPTVAGGVLPHVTLVVPTTVGESEEPAGARVATLGFGGPISPATVGLVLCEAAVRRIMVDDQSAPLDVGREARLVTAAIRRALEVRDRGCAHPGCGRPIAWTDAHHCVPWSEGGRTSLDNCVLLCRMHHTMIHHTAWEVFIGTDGHPWFRDPEGRVLRSNARRTLTLAPTAAA